MSLGTGYHRQQTNSPSTSCPRGILRDGSIPRLYRALLSSLSGRKLWQEFRNRRRADARGRHFHFDMDFDGQEPDLDNTSKMQDLQAHARAEFSESKELHNLARRVVASRFYFELESRPRYEKGQISGAGHISCRLRSDDPALEVLLDQLSENSARFLLGDRVLPDVIKPGVIDDRSFVHRSGNFRKRLEFNVSDRQHKILIALKEGSSIPNGISGSPFSVDSFIAVQGMDAPFGRDDFEAPGGKRRRIAS